MISTFISYRRDGVYTQEGTLYARNISLYFEVNHKDIALFYDMDSMKAGKFNTQIFSAIRKCDCIVLLLPKGAFDRCGDPDDWLRREIRLGLQNRKPFIPVFLEGFEWPETLPDDIADIRNYQGITLYNEHFNEIMEKLALRIRESVRGTRRPKKRSTNLPAIALSLVILLLGGILLHHYITGLPDYDTFGQEEIASNTSDSTENDVVETFPDIDTVPPDSFADTPDENTDGIWDSYLTIYGIYESSGEYSWKAVMENTESLTYWIYDGIKPIRESTITGPSEKNTLITLGTSPFSQETTLYVDADFTDGTSFSGYYHINASETDFGENVSTALPSVSIESETDGLYVKVQSSENILLCKYQPEPGDHIYIFEDRILQPHVTSFNKNKLDEDNLSGADWLNVYALNGSGNYTIHTYRIPDSVKNPQ